MTAKIHPPRSCLGCMAWLGWLLIALIAFVFLYYGYVQMSTSLARTQAEELAIELGYTPESFLSQRMQMSNVNIVTGSMLCHTEFYFVTPLEPSEFEERLQQAKPGSLRFDPFPGYRTEIYLHLPLTVNGVEANPFNPWLDRDAFTAIPTFSWALPDEFLTGGGVAYLYQTTSVASTLTYGDHPIDGNIAVIRRDAGRFPFWVLWC